MAYYLAPALRQCPADLGVRSPSFARRGTSDGWIGDASHQARPSDHNPDWADGGVVRAIDLDVHTGALAGKGMAVVAAAIAHPSTQYVIHMGSIWNRKHGPFRRRAYSGHPHDHHVHISIRHTKGAETSTTPWRLVGATPTPVAPATPVTPEEGFLMTLSNDEQAELLRKVRALPTAADIDERLAGALEARRTTAAGDVWGYGLGKDPLDPERTVTAGAAVLGTRRDASFGRRYAIAASTTSASAAEQARAASADVLEQIDDLPDDVAAAVRRELARALAGTPGASS